MSENKTIAKNSIILYFRLLATTIIGLYASRIVLLELGAENFGLYAVVGGLVAMMSFLNTSMISTSNRFIAVEIGKKEGSDLKKVFNTLLIIHILFSVLLVLTAEFAGVWYVRNYLNVDASKISDALFVLHLSTISAVIATIIIPYQGLITANEKFKLRAVVEIINSLLNLGVVLLLVYHSGNKLRAYAVYILMVQLLVALIYYIYSRYKYFDIIKWKINRQASDYVEVSRFFGWQLVYVFGSVGSKQGAAIIINLFFGTLLNAAFGIASRVFEFVFSFVKNLNQAALPQIMKNFSGGNQDRSLKLIYKLSKLTYFIMLIPAVPIILSIDNLLVIWLKNVPQYTSVFVVLLIINGLVSCLESGFDATIDATGRIKQTKIIFSILFLLTLPLIYLLYSLKFPPYTITILYVIVEIVFLLFQTRILSKLTEFKFSAYFSLTIRPVFFVTLLIVPQYFLSNIFGSGLMNFFLLSIISVLLTIITIYFFGLSREERNIIILNACKIPLINRLVLLAN